jgi:hypothetical protein
MIVLTGMIFENRATLYDEAKEFLKIFKGETCGNAHTSSASIKLEPSFLAKNEEGLTTAGYARIPMKGNKYDKGGGRYEQT